MIDHYEIHYCYAADKIKVHLAIKGADELLKQLTRLLQDGAALRGVSWWQEEEKQQ